MSEPSTLSAVKCRYCPQLVEQSDAAMKQHLIESHGCVNIEGHVFLRRFCHCGKAGLYKVGGDVFCKDHRHEAVQRRVRVNVKFETKSAHFSEEAKRRDQVDLARRQFHRTSGMKRRG